MKRHITKSKTAKKIKQVQSKPLSKRGGARPNSGPHKTQARLDLGADPLKLLNRYLFLREALFFDFSTPKRYLEEYLLRHLNGAVFQREVLKMEEELIKKLAREKTDEES